MRISDWSSDVCSSDLNAIKYAVTPKEEGAEIVVQSRLAGDRVQITVTDTGPGLRETKTRPSLSTGFGMANFKIGRAHDYTTVTNAHLVFRTFSDSTKFSAHTTYPIQLISHLHYT